MTLEDILSDVEHALSVAVAGASLRSIEEVIERTIGERHPRLPYHRVRVMPGADAQHLRVLVLGLDLHIKVQGKS